MDLWINQKINWWIRPEAQHKYVLSESDHCHSQFYIVFLFFSTATLEADDSLVQNGSSTETYLYLDWATLLKAVEKSSWCYDQCFTQKFILGGSWESKHQCLLCETLAEANSVKLKHTSRLMNQVGSFVHKLKQCFNKKMKMSHFSRQQCVKQMEKSSPWACKVLESEFCHRNQFEMVCKKNVERGPHPKWTEFENDVDFQVALIQAASIQGNGILNNCFIWTCLWLFVAPQSYCSLSCLYE